MRADADSAFLSDFGEVPCRLVYGWVCTVFRGGAWAVWIRLCELNVHVHV